MSIRQSSKVIVIQYPNGKILVSQVIAGHICNELESIGCKVTLTHVENKIDGLRGENE